MIDAFQRDELHRLRHSQGVCIKKSRKTSAEWKLETARSFRNTPTLAEKTLHKVLKRSKGIYPAGAKFRRQCLMGGYFLDFFCLSASLAVEVDGGYHAARQEEDRLRDERLARFGIKTLRFTNAEVLADPTAVLAVIKEEVDRRHFEGLYRA